MRKPVPSEQMIAFVVLASVLSLSAHASESPADMAVEFRKECAAKAAACEGMGVLGKEGWYFFKGELRHVGVGEFWGAAAEKTGRSSQPENRDPLAAILHYKEQLDKQGIELILLPVPPKAEIYPDNLSDLVKQVDTQPIVRVDDFHQNFYRQLREHGVGVVDLVPEFIAHRLDKDAGPLYCRTDTHWSGAGCALAAQIIATELQNRAWLKDVPRKKFDVEEKQIAIRGDLLPQGAAEKTAAENVSLRFVGQKESASHTLVPLAIPDAFSPVLILSDSHGLVFHVGEELFAKGAGFPDQLANELGLGVDLIASRGDGVSNVRIDLYQHARSDPAWLARKKVVIWCFSAREFTESTNGWRKLPVKK